MALIWMTPDFQNGWLHAVASNWSISGIGRFFSGRPLNVTLTSDPGNKAVDLSLVRRFRFGAQVIEARAEAFNAFNWFNPGAE